MPTFPKEKKRRGKRGKKKGSRIQNTTYYMGIVAFRGHTTRQHTHRDEMSRHLHYPIRCTADLNCEMFTEIYCKCSGKTSTMDSKGDWCTTGYHDLNRASHTNKFRHTPPADLISTRQQGREKQKGTPTEYTRFFDVDSDLTV